jgi:hypothetical protein
MRQEAGRTVSPTEADTDSDDASTSGSSQGAGGLFHFTFDVRKPWHGLGALKACPPTLSPHVGGRRRQRALPGCLRRARGRPGCCSGGHLASAATAAAQTEPVAQGSCTDAALETCSPSPRVRRVEPGGLREQRARARRRCARATCWARAVSGTAWPRPATSRAPTGARARCGGWRPHLAARRRRRGTGCRCRVSRPTSRRRTCRAWRSCCWCAARAATCSRSSRSCAARRPRVATLCHTAVCATVHCRNRVVRVTRCMHWQAWLWGPCAPLTLTMRRVRSRATRVQETGS